MLHHLLTILLLFTFSVAVAQEEESQEDESKRPSWSAGLPERTKAADLNKPDFKPDNDIEIDMSDFGLQETTEIEMALPIGETMSIKAEKPTAEEMAEQLANEDPYEEDLYEEDLLDDEVTELETEPVMVAEPVVEEPVMEEPAAEESVVLESANETSVADVPADTSNTEQVADAQPPVTETIAEEDESVDDSAVITEAVAEESMDEFASDDEVAEEGVFEKSIASIDPPVMTEELDPVSAAADSVDYQWKILKQAPVKYPVRAAMDNHEGWVDVEVTIDPSGKVVSVSPVKYSPRGRIFGKPAVQSVNDWLFSPPSALGITQNQTRVYKIEFEL